MYTTKNYRTKKALKDDLAELIGARLTRTTLAGVMTEAREAQDNARIAQLEANLTVFQPGPFADRAPKNGNVTLEGPHFPEPHRWYANAVISNGIIVKVR